MSVSIGVRVIPRAVRAAISGRRNDAWVVRVNAAPADGAANREVIRVLAAALDLPVRAVQIASGQTSRHKRVLITGLDAAEVARRLTAAVDQ